MTEVSLFRLYLLRALYLLIAVGLAFDIAPQLLHPAKALTLWHGVGCSLLAAMALLSLPALRYPLKMLPLLFFELVWKSIWLAAIALPLWLAGKMDADTWDTAQACLMGVIVPIVIPWHYVVANFVKAPGDRWW